jgi:glycosyltransferase involved in cell wall biosynthesis
MIEKPLVSVLMTSYNRQRFIAEAIESVLNSTYKNFELIIVDDASTDRTLEIAKKFELKDKRIRVYANEKNLTQFPNRNKAAGYAKGKYIKYLDSDDAIYDWGLQYCVESMEKYPEAGMGIFKAQNSVKEEFLKSADAINKHFFENNFLNIGPSGIILKREAFEKIGYYNPNYGVPSDIYFNIKIASFFPVVILKNTFFFYREHEHQEIKDRYSYLLNTYPYLRDILKLPELPLSYTKRMKLLTSAKRSFVKECLKSIIETKKVRPTYFAFKNSGMDLKDILSGIINRPI